MHGPSKLPPCCNQSLRRVPWAASFYAIHPPELAPAHIAGKLRCKLSLDAEQTHKVQEILTHRQADLQTLRRQIQPQVEDQLKATYDEIAAILTPDQTRRWEGMYETFRHRWVPPLPQERKTGRQGAEETRSNGQSSRPSTNDK